MRRYEFNEEDDFDEAEYMFGFRDEEEDDEYIKGEIFNALQLDAIEHELNLKLLSAAIKLLETGFWWRFTSLPKKIELIKKTYSDLNNLISRDEPYNEFEGEVDDSAI